MTEPLSDIERAILRFGRKIIARLEERIANRRTAKLPTDVRDVRLKKHQSVASIRKVHLDEFSKSTIGYECTLMVGESIRGVEAFRCREDAEVIVGAAGTLDTKPDYNLSIWAGAQIVGCFPRQPKPE